MKSTISKTIFVIALLLAICPIVASGIGVFMPVLTGIFENGHPIIAYLKYNVSPVGLWTSCAGLVIYFVYLISSPQGTFHGGGSFIICSCLYGITYSTPGIRFVGRNGEDVLLYGTPVLFIGAFLALWLHSKFKNVQATKSP